MPFHLSEHFTYLNSFLPKVVRITEDGLYFIVIIMYDVATTTQHATAVCRTVVILNSVVGVGSLVFAIHE